MQTSTDSTTAKKQRQYWREIQEPKRPCIYCGNFQSKLERHLKLKHKDQPDVILAMESSKVEWNRFVSNTKKQGILQHNRKFIEDSNSKSNITLLREMN